MNNSVGYKKECKMQIDIYIFYCKVVTVSLHCIYSNLFNCFKNPSLFMVFSNQQLLFFEIHTCITNFDTCILKQEMRFHSFTQTPNQRKKSKRAATSPTQDPTSDKDQTTILIRIPRPRQTSGNIQKAGGISAWN